MYAKRLGKDCGIKIGVITGNKKGKCGDLNFS